MRAFSGIGWICATLSPFAHGIRYPSPSILFTCIGYPTLTSNVRVRMLPKTLDTLHPFCNLITGRYWDLSVYTRPLYFFHLFWAGRVDFWATLVWDFFGLMWMVSAMAGRSKMIYMCSGCGKEIELLGKERDQFANRGLMGMIGRREEKNI